MNTNPENVILRRLLDKYEASEHPLHPGKSNRRVMLQTKRKNDFPEYDYETASVRDAFNNAAEELAKQDIVSLEWIADRPVLSVIALNLNRVEAAYGLSGWKHPRDVAQSVIEATQSALRDVETPWIVAWRETVCRDARERCRVPAFRKNEPDSFKDLLNVFHCYDSLRGGAITVRAFSIRCFRDSKRFEKDYQKKFLEIARKFCVGLAETLTEEKRSEREQ